MSEQMLRWNSLPPTGTVRVRHQHNEGKIKQQEIAYVQLSVKQVKTIRDVSYRTSCVGGEAHHKLSFAYYDDD